DLLLGACADHALGGYVTQHSDADILAHAQIGEDAVGLAFLGQIDQAIADRPLWRAERPGPPAESGAAGGLRKQAEQSLHDLRPPCTDQSGHAEDLAFTHAEGDILETRAAKALDRQHFLTLRQNRPVERI